MGPDSLESGSLLPTTTRPGTAEWRSSTLPQWFTIRSLLLIAVVQFGIIFVGLNMLLYIMGDRRISPPTSANYEFGYNWKNESNLSSSTVLNHISFWTYRKQPPEPDMELFPPPDNEQFLTFEPDHGAFNNIRLQFETVVILARVTRRTLVLPPANHWTFLNGDCHFRDFFDINELQRRLNVIDMDEYLHRVSAPISSQSHSNADVFDYLRDDPGSYSPRWDTGSVALVFPSPVDRGGRIPTMDQFLKGRRAVFYDPHLQSYRNLHIRSDYQKQYRLLGLSCTFFYFPTLQWERYAQGLIRDALHYHPSIFQSASKVIQKLLLRSGGSYNAVHIRRNDFKVQFPDQVIPLDQIAANIAPLLDPSMALYVATDETDRDSPDFHAFKSMFPHVFFLDDLDLDEDGLVLSSNYIGMIEQIVCSVAERFVGNEASTFSSCIHRMRGHMAADVAPDKNIYLTSDASSGYAHIDGWRTDTTWMEVNDDPRWKSVSAPYWGGREFFLSWALE